MDVQDKHITELLNSKCDVVNELYLACKKAEYGDIDVYCCLKTMYAKTRLIDRLDCYEFPINAEDVVYNCIEDSDLPKMYEVLKKLGK